MTLPKAIIISEKDSKEVEKFKKKIAKRDNLKVIKRDEEKPEHYLNNRL